MATQPTQKNSLTFKEMIGTEMVDLYVGDKKEHYRVHKDLLCSKIPYFEKMFKGGFTESSNNLASFPEDNPESFDLLLEWVYHGSLRKFTQVQGADRATSWTVSWRLQDAYKLAEKLCLSEFMDRIVDSYRGINQEVNSLPSAAFLAEGLRKLPKSGFRNYLQRSYEYLVLSQHNEAVWPTEALAEMLVENPDTACEILKLFRGKSGKVVEDPRKLPPCEFHSHGDKEVCYLEKDKDKK